MGKVLEIPPKNVQIDNKLMKGSPNVLGTLEMPINALLREQFPAHQDSFQRVNAGKKAEITKMTVAGCRLLPRRKRWGPPGPRPSSSAQEHVPKRTAELQPHRGILNIQQPHSG